MLYIFEDNEAVIKNIINGRSPTMRHGSRTHRVALDWLFDVDRYTSHVIFLMHFARLIVCILIARLKTSQGSECLSARFIPSTCHP